MPNVYVTIEVENAEIVRQGLEDFAAEMPKIGRLQLYRASQRIYKRLGIYPAQYPGQIYKRTGELRRSRLIEKTDKGYLVSVAPLDKRGRAYASLVLGYPQGGGQAAYHQGRWVPIALILEEELAELPQEVVQELRAAVARSASRTNGK